MEIIKSGNDLIVNIKDFSLRESFDCGQCFLAEEIEKDKWQVVSGENMVRVSQEGEAVTFYDTTTEDFDGVWKDYFDLGTGYGEMKKMMMADRWMKKSCEYAGGIRILRQTAWDALLSFILSQNSNIPRIKGNIRSLSKLGKDLGNGVHALPSPGVLAGCSLSDLAFVKAGFRDKYLLDAAQKVWSGEVDLEALKTMPIAEAREELMKIRGVGPKVSECVLLFGLYRMEAFPVDVWIKRVLESFYPDGFPEWAKTIGGYAQQVLFHYARNHPEECGA